jgi:hypothetical protein
VANTNDGIAAVLALVQGGASETVEPDLPVPPNGASLRAQEAWYSVLGQVDFETPAEWRLLESIVEVITQYDLVRERWVAEGSPVVSTGSMGQDVEAPALGTMQKLRTQEAALWKALALPTSDSTEKRRPGRPTRLSGGGAWGIR